MYCLVFPFSNTEHLRPAPALFLGIYKDIESAAAARQASGDLVVERKSMTVVTDDSWLSDREKSNEKCYARRWMGAKIELKKV
jgi:hypothetical protein